MTTESLIDLLVTDDRFLHAMRQYAMEDTGERDVAEVVISILETKPSQLPKEPFSGTLIAVRDCPFCGDMCEIRKKNPKLPNGKKDTLYRVECLNRACHAMSNWWYPSRAAVAAWNRRANV